MMHRLFSTARVSGLILFLWAAPRILAAEDVLATAAPAVSDDRMSAARNDDVWVVSTRHLCFPSWSDPRSYELDVRRYDRSSGWIESSTAEFCAQSPLETLIYVHGNRVTWDESFHYGWEVYHLLADCHNAPAKMRFVIWTWPSDQIRGPLRDIRSKADRADDETFFLGWFLSQTRSDSQIRLLGYSYGSRILTGGLHLLSGGSLSGISLPQAAQPGRTPARAALLAAAIDCDWLSPGNYHGVALDQLDRMLILYNTLDPALQRYHLVNRRSRASALGYVGANYESLGAFASKVEQLNVCGAVGRSHDEHNYFALNDLKYEVCRVLFHPLPIPNAGE